MKKIKDEEPKVLKLNAKQKSELNEIDNSCAAVKCHISDVTEQILALEKKRDEAFNVLHQKQEEYGKRLNKFANQLGIDPEANPAETGERYTFNVAEGTFARVEVDLATTAT